HYSRPGGRDDVRGVQIPEGQHARHRRGSSDTDQAAPDAAGGGEVADRTAARGRGRALRRNRRGPRRCAGTRGGGGVMAVGQARSMELHGLDGMLVTVDCQLGQEVPGVSVDGLGYGALEQARDRIRAAMMNSTLPWPKSKVVMSRSPADVKKEGSSYYLAMVASILAAQGLSEPGLELLC